MFKSNETMWSKVYGVYSQKHLEIPHFLRKKLKSSEFFHSTGYLQKNHLSIPRLLDFPGYQRMIFLWVPYKCFFMCDSKALGVLRYKKLVYTPPMSAAVERFRILSYQQHNSKKGAILIEKASAVHLLRPNDVQRMLFCIILPGGSISLFILCRRFCPRRRQDPEGCSRSR